MYNFVFINSLLRYAFVLLLLLFLTLLLIADYETVSVLLLFPRVYGFVSQGGKISQQFKDLVPLG